MVTLRPLTRADYDQWLPLWQANCEHRIADDVTAETWRRLMHVREPVFGLCAETDGRIVGILHYILHPTTGQIAPVCYMQDLFVDPACRRQGVARRLVWELRDIGQSARWGRIYWLAKNDNAAAQALYRDIAPRMPFDLHVLATG